MRLGLLSCVLALIVFVTTVSGLNEDTVSRPSEAWKLQVDLVDGSRIVGEPENKSLQLDVEFERLQIPLDRVRQARWLNDRRSVRVELRNRDVITGRITAKQIAMSTLFGDVTLKTSQMKALEVIPANRLGWLPSERDLVLYFSFDRDDGTKVVNHASDQLHGRASNVRWIHDGRRGGAVDLDGNASIEIPHHKDLCPQKLTLAVWIQPTSIGGSYEMVIAKTNGGSWSQGYGLVGRSGEPNHLTFFVNQYSSSGAMVKAEIGKWSHITGVFDGDQVSVYLNGELAGKVKVPATSSDAEPFDDQNRYETRSNIKHSNTAMYIGCNPSGYSWSGKMDELVIYSRALEPAEVRQLYRASAGP